MPSQRFPIFLLIIIGLLATGLLVQTVFILDDNEEFEDVEEDLEPSHADISVTVGDGYFVQDNSDLPDDVLETEVGDLIYFHNEGDIPHTVTIPEFGLDEHLNPGESVFLEADESVDSTLVDCTLHAHHEATLTVNE